MNAAVNGPARHHAELAVLCDIVLASDTALVQDAPHFDSGLVRDDGVHLVWPLLLGPNRGRYFLLTGQELSAADALALGVVNEVLSRNRVLTRAWQLAEQLARQPPRTVRYTRVVLIQQLRRLLADGLELGMALEGLAAMEHWPPRRGRNPTAVKGGAPPRRHPCERRRAAAGGRPPLCMPSAVAARRVNAAPTRTGGPSGASRHPLVRRSPRELGHALLDAAGTNLDVGAPSKTPVTAYVRESR